MLRGPWVTPAAAGRRLLLLPLLLLPPPLLLLLLLFARNVAGDQEEEEVGALASGTRGEIGPLPVMALATARLLLLRPSDCKKFLGRAEAGDDVGEDEAVSDCLGDREMA
jgi:hypothetical protein